jgi:hypothetical protein
MMAVSLNCSVDESQERRVFQMCYGDVTVLNLAVVLASSWGMWLRDSAATVPTITVTRSGGGSGFRGFLLDAFPQEAVIHPSR